MKRKKQLTSLTYYHHVLNVSELGNSRIGPDCGKGDVTMRQSIEIQMLPRNMSTNIKEMERITNIVNNSFRTSEKGIWMNGTTRTTVLETTEFTSNGEIAVARLMEKIVG